MKCDNCKENDAVFFGHKKKDDKIEALCFTCAIDKKYTEEEIRNQINDSMKNMKKISKKYSLDLENDDDKLNKKSIDQIKNDNQRKQEIKENIYEQFYNPDEILSKIDLDTMNEITKQMDKFMENMPEDLKELYDDYVQKTYDTDEYDVDDEIEEQEKKDLPFASFSFGRLEPDGSVKNLGTYNKGFKGRNNQATKEREKVKEKKKKFLDTYGQNLTEKAKKGQLDNIIGREKEIVRTIEILNRRTKNNPCLIGEPGVGKTAIAQGLAQKVANGEVPAKLLDKEIYLLDMTSVIAGTQFRGQFEQRVKGIVEECKKLGNIILVIDEVHSIVGFGDAENSTNAANMLKPALSNGEIQIIGTTTLNEYRKYIEKDSALERRFQPVLVEEPSVENTIEIIDGIKKYYEEYHKVLISKDMIRKAVEMTEKYIHNRFLPDKAIDVIDEACSKINLKNKNIAKLEKLKLELRKREEEKEDCVLTDSPEDYKKAADLKTQECKLKKQIDELEKRIKPVTLKEEDIAKIIEQWTNIPVSKITEKENEKLKNLEENIRKRVIGQDEAVNLISRAIKRKRMGLQSEKRPPSFIFVGPTGVRKNRTCKNSSKRNLWK